MKNIKKILLAGVLTTAVAGGELMTTAMSYAKKGQTVSDKKAKISMQEAKDTAMKNAKSGRIVSAELDKDDGTLKYEIDVLDRNIKREYDIDANTGAILKVKRRVLRAKKNALKPNQSPSNTGAKISMQEAKDIAMKNAKSGRIVSWSNELTPQSMPCTATLCSYSAISALNGMTTTSHRRFLKIGFSFVRSSSSPMSRRHLGSSSRM